MKQGSIVLIIAILVGSFTANAQQRPQKSPAERAEHQTRWMDKHLGITKAQSDKVYDIMLYYARQNEDIKRNEPPGPEKRAGKLEVARDRNTELKAVLTPEQFRGFIDHERDTKTRRQQNRRR